MLEFPGDASSGMLCNKVNDTDVFRDNRPYSLNFGKILRRYNFRAGRHGLLDVARQSFLQSVEDIYKVRYWNDLTTKLPRPN